MDYEIGYDGDSIVAIGIIDVNDTFGAHLLLVDDVMLYQGPIAHNGMTAAGGRAG